MIGKKTSTLLVDGSDHRRGLLARVLRADPQIHVCGTSRGGDHALRALANGVPDVVLIGVDESADDGSETARRIMEQWPLPIVMCGRRGGLELPPTRSRLTEFGAVAWVAMPPPDSDGRDAVASHLCRTLRLMSEVKVVRRWPVSHPCGQRVVTRSEPEPSPPPVTTPADRNPRRIQIVGIGASTGGPPVLQKILAALPGDFPAPLVIVQHITAGFLTGLAEWLNATTGFRVQAAVSGAFPLPGHVYLAPDGMHLSVTSAGRLSVTHGALDGGLRPSVGHLFRSLAAVYGRSAAGVLLTGMGKDGAAELKLMRDRGALTIAQDRETSVVHGMPGEAIRLGAATHVLPADQIGLALVTSVAPQSQQGGR